jgi:hypothetical protein
LTDASRCLAFPTAHAYELAHKPAISIQLVKANPEDSTVRCLRWNIVCLVRTRWGHYARMANAGGQGSPFGGGQTAESEGPQDITLHGRSLAVVVSRATFERLSGSGQSLVEFIRKSPLYGLEELDLERDRSVTRKLTL